MSNSAKSEFAPSICWVVINCQPASSNSLVATGTDVTLLPELSNSGNVSAPSIVCLPHISISVGFSSIDC